MIFLSKKLMQSHADLKKTYMGKYFMEDKLYLIIDQFNERKTTPAKFYSILLINMYPFYHRNSRTCKILFANDDK